MTQTEVVSPCPSRTPFEAVEVIAIGDDERPISGVAVTLRSPSLGHQRDVTDARGRCRFEGVPPGETAQLCLDELHEEAWELVTALRLASKAAASRSITTWTSVGPKPRPEQTHRVDDGECLYRVAYAHGFSPETLWDANEGVFGPCHSKGVLSPGLELRVPTRSLRWVDAASGNVAVLHRIGLPVVMTLRILGVGGRVWAESPYVLRLRAADGRPVPQQVGVTDRGGRLHVPVLPDVVEGTLEIEPRIGGRRWTVELSIGSLRPADEPEGASARLWNLGFRRGSGRLWREGDVLATFQREAMGKEPHPLDEATARVLVDHHGS